MNVGAGCEAGYTIFSHPRTKEIGGTLLYWQFTERASLEVVVCLEASTTLFDIQ